MPSDAPPTLEARSGTEVPDASPGVASPPPVFFTVVLWMGAFFAIAWGFQVLFARMSRPDRPFARDDGSPPDAEDVTLEESGPDRS